MEQKMKSGFIAVIGRPNVGKSTLINTLIGQKIAIMSDKPQTTRNRILCILTQPDAQIVFLDTPGIHKPKHKLGEYMVKAAEGTLREVDAIFFVVDATEKMGPGEHYILERLQATKRPVILVVNKLDLIEREQALPIISNYTSKYEFAGVVPISAKVEADIAELPEDEAKEFLAMEGMTESGLNRLIKAGFKLLGLQTYLTAGEIESRAWTINIGTKAPQAAGKIHTDFEKGFIKAEIVSYDDLVKCGSKVAAREKGLVRLEGKDYVMQDGDVVEFRFNV